MNLTLDIGNTSTKATLYEGDVIIRKERLQSNDYLLINAFIGSADIDGVIISSVNRNPKELASLMANKSKRVHLLTWKSRFPFRIKYKTPQTLGIDRLAAVTGAILHHPQHDLLVIDAGSAVTYDLIIAGSYLGGSISPGLSMRFRALNQYTSKLPLVEQPESFSFPGDTTEDAIAGGVLMGLAFETTGYILSYRQKYKSLITVITGGDAEVLKQHADNKMIWHPDLVSDGLNYLLKLNE